ncbi:polyprenyl synthetase family protein [Fructilactobacillus cliffordii]|uniref:Polyprenyl synthetase family protein n=1 Tax=Fructilactobacillus cliffordii TaxID=2940299 RepID=A0A9Q8ZPE7_9LACO|nr:polyprenyl synthetase family protein [Fructilactobacillus cliffordii]USS89139.1 polyprenyl synthetase family protein [Fructilactobacillus cliffordii]
MDKLTHVLPPQLQTDLHAVEQRLLQLNVENPTQKAALQKLITGSGKMLRATFVLLASTWGPETPDRDRVINAAAAVEVIHLASLVHDDVIDDATIRRGQPTLNSQFGEQTAIYLGDYLFTKYFELLLSYSTDFTNLEYCVTAMKAVLAGEIQQTELNFNLHRTEADYLRAVQGKTNELFRISFGQGARLAGADYATAQTAEELGNQIGFAFQILNDLTDFRVDPKTGLPRLNDVQEGTYTLPIIKTLASDRGPELAVLLKKDHLELGDLNLIVQLVTESGGLAAAQTIGENYVHASLQLLDQLPQNSSTRLLRKLLHRVFATL